MRYLFCLAVIGCAPVYRYQILHVAPSATPGEVYLLTSSDDPKSMGTSVLRCQAGPAGSAPTSCEHFVGKAEVERIFDGRPGLVDVGTTDAVRFLHDVYLALSRPRPGAAQVRQDAAALGRLPLSPRTIAQLVEANRGMPNGSIAQLVQRVVEQR